MGKEIPKLMGNYELEKTKVERKVLKMKQLLKNECKLSK